jgi:competence protein ComK
MYEYTINHNTLAIIPITDDKTKVYENNNVIIVKKNVQKIIEENCEYYGSSYMGRKKGTVELIGVTHKSPIVIEDSNSIIFFPTCSPRLKKCSWISLNNLDSYAPYDAESIIRFQNNLTLQLPVSNKIINNQVLRATRLESVLHKRKTNLIKEKEQKFI